jgi:hypothetical protein
MQAQGSAPAKQKGYPGGALDRSALRNVFAKYNSAKKTGR